MEGKKSYLGTVIGVAFTAGLILFIVGKFKGKKQTEALDAPKTNKDKVIDFIKKIFKVKPVSASETLGVGNVKNKHMKTYFNFKTTNTGDLPTDMTAFTKEAEGGMVTAKTDHASTYSKVSAKEPVHTNIGITREVFDKYAPILGYDNSYLSFLKMDPNVWYKIFSTVYVKPFEMISGVPVINDMIAGWGWGSGVGTAKASLAKFLAANNATSLNELISKTSAQDIFEKLVLWRMEFFKDISPKYNPRTAKAPNGVYTDGWLNRESNFYNIFLPYIK